MLFVGCDNRWKCHEGELRECVHRCVDRVCVGSVCVAHQAYGGHFPAEVEESGDLCDLHVVGVLVRGVPDGHHRLEERQGRFRERLERRAASSLEKKGGIIVDGVRGGKRETGGDNCRGCMGDKRECVVDV